MATSKDNLQVREKLMELIDGVPPHEGKTFEEALADHLIANNVTVQEQGRWVWKGKSKGYFCSVCGGGCLLNYESDWHESRYCPHCGNPMLPTSPKGEKNG